MNTPLSPDEIAFLLAHPEKLWSRVVRRGPHECWPWCGTISDGYGHFKISINKRKRMIRAHRMAFLIANGYLPEAPLLIRHWPCGNPVCCNPAHLVAGTPRDNVADMFAMGRASIGDDHWLRRHPERARRDFNTPLTAARGERNGNSRLTADIVITIHSMRADGHSYGQIAKIVGVTKRSVINVIQGKVWAHVVYHPDGPTVG